MNKMICESTIEQFLNNLSSDFDAQKYENGCLLITPYYYPDFAAIEIFIEPKKNGYILSDMGETLNMLFVNGLTLEKNNNLYKEAQRIANLYDAKLANSIIIIEADRAHLGLASNNLINAIQAIGYLIYKRRNTQYSSFDDEVEKFFLSNEVRYDFRFPVNGKSANHNIKFHINSHKNLLIEPVTASSIGRAKNKARVIAFTWLDIAQIHDVFRFVTVVDDRNDKWEKFWTDPEASGPSSLIQQK
jgi:hypothetical protein